MPEFQPFVAFAYVEPHRQQIGVVCSAGRKWIKFVHLAETGVRVSNLPLGATFRVPEGSKPYPVRRAARNYKRMGKQWGISKGALAALKEAAATK
jgi:hypothetical protein